MTNILVTGAAGFMGSHLVEALLGTGRRIWGIDDLSGGYRRNIPKGCRFIKLDLRDKRKTEAAIRMIRPSLVHHLAADATEGRSQFTPLECTERNYLAHMNLLVPCIKYGMKRIVVTSSMSVYGAQKAPFHEDMDPKPEDIYAISKAAMENSTRILAEVFRFEYVIVRPHNVYGERQNMADPYRNVVAIFINRLLQGKPFFIYGDGRQKRSFTHIDDFNPYLVKCGFQKNVAGQIFNIGPREEHSINELAKIVLEAFFGSVRKTPRRLLPIHLPPRPKEVKEAFCTSHKAERMLGYRTRVSLCEGVRRLVEWARRIGPTAPKYLPGGLELVTRDTPLTWRSRLI
jgi:UDP-glucose 4-epimerase